MFMNVFPSFVFLAFARFVAGHIALWDESMFGRCGNNNICVNTEQPVEPLQDMTFNQWWWHGYMNFPPANDAVMALPAGKSVTVHLAGNSAFTKVGQHPEAFWPGGGSNTLDESIVDPHFWNNPPAGNLHTTGKADVNGCVLAIAYTDNAKNVRPEDFVVFSVQQTCVWHRDTVFDVPADMPPCPNGKCMCSWFWIHNSNGGSDQMFQTPFQCNITYESGQKVSTKAVGKPVPPTNCENDKSKCIKGPKQPMYWKQLECNNMPEPGHFAPSYNNRYGFAQGAQNDIFETINTSNWTCPQSKAPGVFASQGNSPAPAQQPAPVSSSKPAATSKPVSISKPVSTSKPAPISKPASASSSVPVASQPSKPAATTSKVIPTSSKVTLKSLPTAINPPISILPLPISSAAAAPASSTRPLSSGSSSQCSSIHRSKRRHLNLRRLAKHHH